MYPVDTIKTRLQLNQPFSFQGLHRGLGASLAGQVPYGVLTFGGYAVYKEQLRALFPKGSNLSIFTAAAVLGDLTGSAWLCPSEVVKQQLQGGLYPNSKAALAAILKKDGIGGLYRGYAGNVARDVPFRVAQMLSYELCKAAVLFRRSQRSKLPLPEAGLASAPALALTSGEAALCGAAAGSFAAAITCPLDKVKTLLMTGKYTGSYAGCVRHIVDTQGVKGLWGGLLPRVALIGPSVAIFFLVYEKVEQQLVGKKVI
jgi:solute carrier family 25 S-adenosylmethionine transporter 26